MSRGLTETKAALPILGRRAPSSVNKTAMPPGRSVFVCLRTGKEARWYNRVGKGKRIDQRTGDTELELRMSAFLL